jgi:hypothetical protein
LSQFSDEIKLISKWARVLAVLVLVVFPVAAMCYFFLNARSGEFGAGKFPLELVMVTIASVFFGVYILILGYIYGDAKRRGMRPVLWLLLGMFIPNAIGVILYFILRQPIQTHCSSCGAANPPGFAFCSSCGAALGRSCPSCKSAVETNWTHCPRCGTHLDSITPSTR